MRDPGLERRQRDAVAEARQPRVGWVNAHSTRRGLPALLHASPATPVPMVTGGGYEAVCGARVRQITTVVWRPRGAIERCGACVTAVAEADAWR